MLSSNIIRITPFPIMKGFETYLKRHHEPVKTYNIFKSLSPDTLRAMQDKKFVREFRYAYENVPAYQKLCKEKGIETDDVKVLDDITKLPTTDRNYFLDNEIEDTLAVPRSKILRFYETSGYGGKTKTVGFTKNDLNSVYDFLRLVCGVTGLKGGDVMLNEFLYGLWPTGLSVQEAADRIGVTCIPGSMNVSPGHQLELIEKYKPKLLVGMPSYIALLLKTADEEGYNLEDSSVEKIEVGGEPTSSEFRKMLEDRFDAEVFNSYGSTETGIGSATECEEHDGLHVNIDLYAEVLDKNGRPLGPNEEGELVFTHLTREGTPIIRYRIGDVSSFYEAQCVCGLPLPKIKDVVGRIDDMFKVSGVNIYPQQLDECLTKHSSAWELTVDKRSPDKPVLNFKINPDNYPEDYITTQLIKDLTSMSPELIDCKNRGLVGIEIGFSDKTKTLFALGSGKKRYNIHVIE